MNDNWLVLGVIAVISTTSVFKAYIGLKAKQPLMREIEQLQRRLEALEGKADRT